MVGDAVASAAEQQRHFNHQSERRGLSSFVRFCRCQRNEQKLSGQSRAEYPLTVLMAFLEYMQVTATATTTTVTTTTFFDFLCREFLRLKACSSQGYNHLPPLSIALSISFSLHDDFSSAAVKVCSQDPKTQDPS